MLEPGKSRGVKVEVSSERGDNEISLCGVIFQRSQVLGNKIEMEITQLVEQNPTLLRLGLHLEFNDARHRVAAHLQRNIDRSKYTKSVPTRTVNSIFQLIIVISQIIDKSGGTKVVPFSRMRSRYLRAEIV